MAIMLNSRTFVATLAALAAGAAILGLRHSAAVSAAQVARAQAYERATAAAANAAPPAGFRSYNQPLTRKRVLVDAGAPTDGSTAPAGAGRRSDRNAELYRRLGAQMSPEVLARFKELVEQKQQALGDAIDYVRSAGMDPESARPMVEQMVNAVRTQVDAQIKAELDPATYEAYQQYEQSMGPPDGPPMGDMPGPPPDGPPN